MTSLQTLPYKIFKQQLAIRTTSASISCFMSFLLLVMILWNQDGLKSPYSRIIFFISIGDILQSLGLIVGPHAIPKEYSDLGAYWAKGITATCDYAGIITDMGSIYLVPFYALLLSYYFLKRVKDKIKPAEFANTYEIKIHAIIWVFAVSACTYAYTKNFMNPNEEGQVCMIFDTREEFECALRDDPDETCTRGRLYRKITILATGPLSLGLLLLIFNLVRLILYVYKQERVMHLEALDQENRRANLEMNNNREANLDDNPNIPETVMVGNEHEQEEEREQHRNEEIEKKSCCWIKCGKNDTDKKRSLTQEALIQSSMYVVSFVVTYSLPSIVFLLLEFNGGNVPIWLRWLQAALFPLNGLFTMLIYTRPKVQQVRRNFPEIAHMNYVVHLLIVIFSGGETPKEIDFVSSYNDDTSGENEQHFADDNDEMSAKKFNQISSLSNESIFANIRNVSKTIRAGHGRSGNINADDENFISYDREVSNLKSSVMDT